jgi:abortive infection bacteriophage resistance protein
MTAIKQAILSELHRIDSYAANCKANNEPIDVYVIEQALHLAKALKEISEVENLCAHTATSVHNTVPSNTPKHY